MIEKVVLMSDDIAAEDSSWEERLEILPSSVKGSVILKAKKKGKSTITVELNLRELFEALEYVTKKNIIITGD